MRKTSRPKGVVLQSKYGPIRFRPGRPDSPAVFVGEADRLRWELLGRDLAVAFEGTVRSARNALRRKPPGRTLGDLMRWLEAAADRRWRDTSPARLAALSTRRHGAANRRATAARLITEGERNAPIARKLGLSRNTVAAIRRDLHK